MENTLYKLPLLRFFWGSFISSVKYCLFPIYVLALLAVFQHCFVKSAFSETMGCRSKFEGSLLYGGDSILDYFIGFRFPDSIGRNDPFKFSQHDISKSISSGNIFFSSVSSDGKEVSRKESYCCGKGGVCQCVDNKLSQVVTSLSFAFIGCAIMAGIIRLYYFFA